MLGMQCERRIGRDTPTSRAQFSPRTSQIGSRPRTSQILTALTSGQRGQHQLRGNRVATNVDARTSQIGHGADGSAQFSAIEIGSPRPLPRPAMRWSARVTLGSAGVAFVVSVALLLLSRSPTASRSPPGVRRARALAAAVRVSAEGRAKVLKRASGGDAKAASADGEATWTDALFAQADLDGDGLLDKDEVGHPCATLASRADGRLACPPSRRWPLGSPSSNRRAHRQSRSSTAPT